MQEAGNVPGVHFKGRVAMTLDAWKEPALKIPTLTTTRQVREILGSTSFYHLRIPGFAELAKLLYEATKEWHDFTCTKDYQSACDKLKQNLFLTPELTRCDQTMSSLCRYKQRKSSPKHLASGEGL